MGVVEAYTATSNGFTAFGLQDFPGHRFLIALYDRSGGVSSSIATSDTDLDAALTLIDTIATLPNDGSSRRTIHLWEAIVPAGLSANPSINPTVLDGSSTAVDASVVAAVVEEGTGYTLAETASDDSDTSTTTSQATGTTATVPSGDVLVIALETTRGSTTATWTLTDNTPDDPGNGDFNLSITSGTGSSQRRGSMGYHSALAAASQTWDDTVTYGTARMSTAFIAVWTTGQAVVDLAGTADTAADAQGSLQADRPLSGQGDTANDATGSLQATRSLAGTGDNVSDAAGTASVNRALSASGDTANDAFGDLTVTGPTEVFLSGTADTASQASGALTVTRGLAGTADTANDASGTLSTGVDFIPELTGTASTRGLSGKARTDTLSGTATVLGLVGTGVLR